MKKSSRRTKAPCIPETSRSLIWASTDGICLKIPCDLKKVEQIPTVTTNGKEWYCSRRTILGKSSIILIIARFSLTRKRFGKKENCLCGSFKSIAWTVFCFFQFCRYRVRNSFVLSSRGELNISSGVESSRITPPSMKITLVETSRANAIS